MAKVLVIDDGLGTWEVFGGILRGAGYQVVTAPSGHEGLLLAQRDSFGLVVGYRGCTGSGLECWSSY